MNQYRSDRAAAARPRSRAKRARLTSWPAVVRVWRGHRVRDLTALAVGVVGGYAFSHWAAPE